MTDDWDLTLVCTYQETPGDDANEVRQRCLDIGDTVGNWPTDDVKRLLDLANERWKFGGGGTIGIPRDLVDRLRKQESVLDGCFDRPIEPPRVTTFCDQLAQVVAGHGRVDEFPDHRDMILKLADHDVVDRIRARRSQQMMLEIEPRLGEQQASSPSP